MNKHPGSEASETSPCAGPPPGPGEASPPSLLASGRLPRLVVASIVGVLLTIAGLGAALLHERYELAVAGSYSSSLGASRVIAAHLHHVLSSAEALQHLIAARLTAGGLQQTGSAAGMTEVRRLVDLFPEIAFVVLLDGRGRVVANSHFALASAIDNSDREYFRRHRQGEAFVIGEPVRSRSVGKDVFTLSRALRNAAGELSAVIVVAVERVHLEYLFSRHVRGGVAVALRDDGTILTRAPQVPLGEKLPSTTPLLHLARTAPEGSYEAVSPFDRDRRYFSYGKVQDFPVYVLVSERSSDVLAKWRSDAALLLMLLLGAALALLVAGRLALLALGEEARARRRLENSQRFSLAILDSVSAHIAIVARDGRILATNRAWRDFALRNGLGEGEAVEGSSYFKACEHADHEDARTALAGISSVMTGAAKEFQFDYACHAPDEQRWFTMKVTPLLDAQGAVLVSHENVTRLMEAKQALRALAETDALTGLANRRRFLEEAERQFALARRHQRPLAVLVLDCDHFKRVNDARGHEVGDQVLVAVARALSRSVRKKDLVGRLGGEEFAVLLPETELDGAVRVAQHVRAAVVAHPGPVTVTVSVGVAVLRRDMEDLATLLRAADAALYAAKQNGRDRVEVAHAPPSRL
ncbi:sensor domain-containing diguanylate cyclase [Caldimonas tepidiphila]|uniref:sensor domain-containing diguanylate cyclase n=1 Tax=Caldimonas tepidiphila TaxID=2315841 RepID=UPI001473F683|nr:diguanylate cyclase [Caldimonas tepidiphila]